MTMHTASTGSNRLLLALCSGLFLLVQAGCKPSGTEGKALAQLQASAKRGDRQAQFELGVCYRDGKGTPTNAPEAVAYFRRAAQNGLAKAQVELGNCYMRGTGTEQDLTRAMDCFR